VSLNLSQLYVRYPDARDAAEVVLDYHQKRAPEGSFVVTSTGSGWLSICSADNAAPPELAQALSRALEAQAVWYGLAGHALAYRLLRWHLGRETERQLEPPEIFSAEGPSVMPAYRDVEEELYRKLRSLEIPAPYVCLFVEEIGVAGGDPGEPDAATVRDGGAALFRHRVPRRDKDQVRTLFDLYKEGEQVVYENLRLQGTYDDARARQLFKTLEAICRRRTLPDGWSVRFLATTAGSPGLAAKLAEAHRAGRYGFEWAVA
jgi:hypothetical protein